MCSHSWGLFTGRTSLKRDFLTPESQMILGEGGWVCDGEMLFGLRKTHSATPAGCWAYAEQSEIGRSEP